MSLRMDEKVYKKIWVRSVEWKMTIASVYDKTIAFPMIDTNRRMRIVEDRVKFDRKLGIALRKKESSRYKLRSEIERTFSILREILGMEYMVC